MAFGHERDGVRRHRRLWTLGAALLAFAGAWWWRRASAPATEPRG